MALERPELEDYRCTGLLGRGQFGTAYLMEPLNPERDLPVVIKRIDLSAMSAGERRDAAREIDVLKRMQHAHIIAHISNWLVEEAVPALCIQMEYANGGTLQQYLLEAKQGAADSERIEPKRYLPEALVADWMVSLLSALQHIHAARVLHRDLKTANIFLHKGPAHGDYPVVKLGDFGIARVLSNTGSMASTVCGTPYYLSPELVGGQSYNTPADVWALGVVCYELACLCRPFEGNNIGALALAVMRHDFAPFPPGGGYSAELERIVGSMLRKDSAERATVEALLSLPYVDGARRRQWERLRAMAATIADAADASASCGSDRRGASATPGALGATATDASTDRTHLVGTLAAGARAAAGGLRCLWFADEGERASWAPIAACGESALVHVTADGAGGALALTASGAVLSWRLPAGARAARRARDASGSGALGEYDRCEGGLCEGPTPALLAALDDLHVRVLACCSASGGRLLAYGAPMYGHDSTPRLHQWEPAAGAAAAPVRGLPARRPVLRLACGEAHCLALVGAERAGGPRPTGDVYSWGRGVEGQTGHALDDDDDDDLRRRLTGSARGLEAPRLIEQLEDEPTLDVQCGAHFSAALLDGGTVQTWGRNDEGQLGHAHAGRAGGGAPVAWVPAEAALPDGFRAAALACGRAHVAALDADGRVACWGAADRGQLGRHRHRVRPWPYGAADSIDGGHLPAGVAVRALVCGGDLTAAVLADGAVYAWGAHAGGFCAEFPTAVRAAQAESAGRVLAAAATGEVLLLVTET
jgi:alpha-tubulin suppressor-like RCC1 family protein